MDETLDQGEEEQATEEPNDHPLRPTREGDHEAHEQRRNPDHHPYGNEQPPDPAVIAEVPRTDPPHELEGREGKIDTSQNHVQGNHGGEVKESGV